MNREDVTESLVEARDEFELGMDLQAAARTRVPVLISGSPTSALRLTEAIAGRLSRTDHSIRILACDVADCGGDLGARPVADRTAPCAARLDPAPARSSYADPGGAVRPATPHDEAGAGSSARVRLVLRVAVRACEGRVCSTPSCSIT